MNKCKQHQCSNIQQNPCLLKLIRGATESNREIRKPSPFFWDFRLRSGNTRLAAQSNNCNLCPFRWKSMSFQVEGSDFRYMYNLCQNLCQLQCLLRVGIQNDILLCSYTILPCKSVSCERLTRQKRKPFTVVNWEFLGCSLEDIWMNRQNLRSFEILCERHVGEPQAIHCYVCYTVYEFLIHIYFFLIWLPH